MRRMAVPLLMTAILANGRLRAFKRVHQSCDAAHQASFFCSVVIVWKARSGSRTNKKPTHLNSDIKLHACCPVIFIGRDQAERSLCLCFVFVFAWVMFAGRRPWLNGPGFVFALCLITYLLTRRLLAFATALFFFPIAPNPECDLGFK